LLFNFVYILRKLGMQMIENIKKNYEKN